jgi:hypothetical protein
MRALAQTHHDAPALGGPSLPHRALAGSGLRGAASGRQQALRSDWVQFAAADEGGEGWAKSR